MVFHVVGYSGHTFQQTGHVLMRSEERCVEDTEREETEEAGAVITPEDKAQGGYLGIVSSLLSSRSHQIPEFLTRTR